MDIIEIIVGILFVAIPVIFKAIGRSLEKSGSDKAGQFRKIAEAFEDEPEYEDSSEEIAMAYAMPEEEAEPVKFVTPVKPVTPVKLKKPVLLENEPEKKVEKIDPKKLVIYSEIMKPKY